VRARSRQREDLAPVLHPADLAQLDVRKRRRFREEIAGNRKDEIGGGLRRIEFGLVLRAELELADRVAGVLEREQGPYSPRVEPDLAHAKSPAGPGEPALVVVVVAVGLVLDPQRRRQALAQPGGLVGLEQELDLDFHETASIAPKRRTGDPISGSPVEGGSAGDPSGLV
jgi:hypothetical protein